MPVPSAPPIVAVDGPAAAGKTTTSVRLAHAIGLDYVESGRPYRAIAHEALRRGFVLGDGDAVRDLAIELAASPHGMAALLDPDDYPDSELRSARVDYAVSTVATLAAVRVVVTAGLRDWAHHAGRGAVVEGRDIGTVMFPNAAVKIFLTAQARERAARRRRQHGGDYAEVLADVMRRDQADLTRVSAPLRAADDALTIDTTGVAVDDVLAEMMRACVAAGVLGSGR